MIFDPSFNVKIIFKIIFLKEKNTIFGLSLNVKRDTECPNNMFRLISNVKIGF